jgi:hypothetical protein
MTAAANKQKPPESLSSLQRKRLALSALCDERTLRRALRGEAMQPMTAERIRRALASEGLLHLLPDKSAGAP